MSKRPRDNDERAAEAAERAAELLEGIDQSLAAIARCVVTMSTSWVAARSMLDPRDRVVLAKKASESIRLIAEDFARARKARR